MTVALTEQYTISVSDIETVSVNFTRHLDNAELLTGTPTVVEVTTTALTLGSKQRNTSSYVDRNNITVAASKAVQFTVTGGAAGVTYAIKVTVSTDAIPARTFNRLLYLTFE